MIEMNEFRATVVVACAIRGLTDVLKAGILAEKDILRAEKAVQWLETKLKDVNNEASTANVLLGLSEDLMREYP